MPFWSRDPQSPAKVQAYLRRSKVRIDFTAREMEHLEKLREIDRLDPKQATKSAKRLRKYALEQLGEVPPPLPGMEEHKVNYYRLIDLEARKVEDIAATGGQNLEAIIAEEEAMAEEAEGQASAANEVSSSYGMAPQFSKK